MRNAWYKLCIFEPVDFEYKKMEENFLNILKLSGLNS